MIPICVDPKKIDDIWPHVEPLISRAFANNRGDDDASIAYSDLKSGDALLWIVWDEEFKIVAAAATTKIFLSSHRGKICLITSCSGIGVHKWVRCVEAIEDYAKAEQCKSIRFSGRRGWKHYFPDWQEPWLVLEKQL